MAHPGDMVQEVEVRLAGATVGGILRVPRGAARVILFAHGSGSGRRSPRNNDVADGLAQAGLASLLVDLLTEDEEALDRRSGHLRFNIGFLAGRLGAAADWLGEAAATAGLGIGCFGASTGAAAALVAAADRPEQIGAVVSRGGRPDLAKDALPRVRAPTLLLVGSLDVEVLRLNRAAFDRLTCEKRLQVVEGASHLFEEPGTLEQVAASARDWFLRHLG